MDTIDTYCHICDKPVVANLVEREETYFVVDKNVNILATIVICPHCGYDIGDSRVMGENLDKAYSIYEDRYGMRPRDAYNKMRNWSELD